DGAGGALDGEGLRSVFALARRHAFAAVTSPAPGTMLTLLERIDDAARTAAGGAGEILAATVAAGAHAVEVSREQNPTNRAAGVVDAGARGLWLLLDGALASLDGHADVKPIAVPPRVVAALAPADVASWEGAYDVQFLVQHPSRPVAEIRTEMLEYGADCVLVVGDESVVKVHVHTLHPDAIIRIGLSAGRIADVVVEDLDAMSEEHERTTGIAVRPRRPLALVTVVPGEGFAEAARALGALPLASGATMNPSTHDLLDAAKAANADRVLLLPNDRNIVLAARQAAEVDSAITVIGTTNLAQGMAALVCFEPDRDPEEVLVRMEEAARASRCLEITRAVRDAHVDGHALRAGDAMGLVDGKVVAGGADEMAVLAAAAAAFGQAELLTLYVGAGVSHERAALARETLSRACADAQVEVVDGGQPHYPFIVQAD
ncbi:MAG: DAK2 domain-containing protein, partial [Chloroflexi bacterium]|nr:DAK2 domain-containing protein [Chloroflexota bacterium]